MEWNLIGLKGLYFNLINHELITGIMDQEFEFLFESEACVWEPTYYVIDYAGAPFL